MSDAIICGDIHLTDEARRPTSRKEGYTQQILGKIQFASGQALIAGVPLVLAGDVFHLKASTKNSHWLVQAMHEALQGVQTFIVPGNHDMAYDRLDSLDKQPLGALCRMDNVGLLLGSNPDLPDIVGVPYLTEFDGGNWKDACDDWAYQIEYAELLVTHAPLFPPGQAPAVYASINPKLWAQYWTGISNCYYGHIHDYHGVYQVEDMTFCNQGALSRGSLHESSINRRPAITGWFDGVFSRIEVPHKSAEDVFLLEKITQKAETALNAKDFAEALGSTKLDVLTLEEIRATLKDSVKDPNVFAAIEEILEAIQ